MWRGSLDAADEISAIGDNLSAHRAKLLRLDTLNIE